MHVIRRTNTRRRFLSVAEGLVVQARSGEASPAAGDKEERQTARSQVELCDEALEDACEGGYCAYTPSTWSKAGLTDE